MTSGSFSFDAEKSLKSINDSLSSLNRNMNDSLRQVDNSLNRVLDKGTQTVDKTLNRAQGVLFEGTACAGVAKEASMKTGLIVGVISIIAGIFIGSVFLGKR